MSKVQHISSGGGICDSGPLVNKDINEGYFIYTARKIDERTVISIMTDFGMYGYNIITPIFRPIVKEIDCGNENIVCFKKKWEAKVIANMITKQYKGAALVGLRVYDSRVDQYFPVWIKYGNKRIFKAIKYVQDKFSTPF